MELLISYDTEADALSVSFREAGVRRGARILNDFRFLHEDDEGVFQVEFIEVTKGINLDDIPHRDEIRAALGTLRPRD